MTHSAQGELPLGRWFESTEAHHSQIANIAGRDTHLEVGTYRGDSSTCTLSRKSLLITPRHVARHQEFDATSFTPPHRGGRWFESTAAHHLARDSSYRARMVHREAFDATTRVRIVRSGSKFP